uniref:Sodium channel modifier 1 n=1 Tax=Leptobrachium leishanense TaxID=445787 RepID=A0A8C5MKL6_9ANUR
MSFKREGDDGSQLNVLKKRRVADLLASYIPEDEALLLRNGRYACTVCSHRPVFDTIDMMSVHRNGKKHVAHLQRFYWKKDEFHKAVQKRQHEQFVRVEESGAQVPAGPAPLLRQTRKITQHALLKATPYNSCCSRNRLVDSGRKESPSGSASDPAASLPQKGWPPSFTESKSDGPGVTGETSQPEQSIETPREHHASLNVGKQKVQRLKRAGHKKTGATASRQTEDKGDCSERSRAMQHYLLLKSSGWIPDGSGNWVKDNSVEFDSDEDEPPALPPP